MDFATVHPFQLFATHNLRSPWSIVMTVLRARRAISLIFILFPPPQNSPRSLTHLLLLYSLFVPSRMLYNKLLVDRGNGETGDNNVVIRSLRVNIVKYTREEQSKKLSKAGNIILPEKIRLCTMQLTRNTRVV